MQGRTKTSVKKKERLYSTYYVIVYTDILTMFYRLYNYF